MPYMPWPPHVSMKFCTDSRSAHGLNHSLSSVIANVSLMDFPAKAEKDVPNRTHNKTTLRKRTIATLSTVPH